MGKRSRPKYTNKHSNQTLQQGLEEYYDINPNITDPRELPPEFAQILLAHDVSHVVLGCDTNMYDEIKLLPLSFWTSDFKFGDYIRTRKDPKIRPAIDETLSRKLPYTFKGFSTNFSSGSVQWQEYIQSGLIDHKVWYRN